MDDALGVRIHQIDHGLCKIAAEGRAAVLVGDHRERVGSVLDLPTDRFDKVPATMPIEPGGANHEVPEGPGGELLTAKFCSPIGGGRRYRIILVIRPVGRASEDIIG